MTDFPDETMVSVNCFDITNLPLQNITMDQTIPVINTANVKLPAKISPTGAMGTTGSGRTMKECEDQLSVLKKENFNLKLRIYFLEERMGITSADEDAIKKNIEFKVENESLRKELIEKQELLSQAAKAIELIEEQKQAYARNQTQYLEKLEEERDRVNKLAKELEEYRAKLTDATYYEATFGIAPEKALEYKEKLHQFEEIKFSLESELRQLSTGLDEERNWAQGLENERDQLRNRLESEILSKEKLSLKRKREVEILSEKLKGLEEQAYKTENLLQQLKKEIMEKDKIIDEKNFIFQEKCKAYDEILEIAEKRKKQVDQLRLSVKSRDDALTDLNCKNRSLLSQFENNYTKRSLSSDSPSTFMEISHNFKKTYSLCSPNKSFNGLSELEPSTARNKGICDVSNGFDKWDIEELKKELNDKERDIKKKDETKKQLMLKLCNVQQSADITDQKLKKLEIDHRKAIQMIQGFLKRHEQLEDKQVKKDRKIMDLEVEISKLRNENAKAIESNTSIQRNLSNDLIDGLEHNDNVQRFVDTESETNNLKEQIELMKTEKNLFEKRIKIEFEELYDRLENKDLKIEYLQSEKNSIKDELHDKNKEILKLKEIYNQANEKVKDSMDIINLRTELIKKNIELTEKNSQVDRLTRELLMKTQNLQKLVNTELWNKNKEIAKLHNYMTTHLQGQINKSRISEESVTNQLKTLIKDLNNIGIQVTSINNIIQLNYMNSDKPIDFITITNYVHQLMAEKNELEKEVDYLKWLKFVTKSANNLEMEIYDSISDKDKHYNILRKHLHEFVRFMIKMLIADTTIQMVNTQKNVIFDVLINSKILSINFINTLEKMTFNDFECGVNVNNNNRIIKTIRNYKFDNLIDCKNQFATPSDSETFSEPDRMVSLARGFSDIKQTSVSKSRSKCTKFSDSNDSIDYYPCHGIYQNNNINFSTNRQIVKLKEINNFLYSDLNIFKNEIIKNTFELTSSKLLMLLDRVEKMRSHCENIQNIFKKKIKKERQSTIRKTRLEKKCFEEEHFFINIIRQKTELMQHKNITDKRITEMLIFLSKENEMLKAKIIQIEKESEETKTIVLRLTRELDHLTLNHSQVLVENTKLTNEKLRLEQDVRKLENHCDITVQILQDKCDKQDSPFWLPITYPICYGRSKSSCSPDLGIESDSAITSIRPLKDTLRITESMTNLLSEDETCSNNQECQDTINSNRLTLKDLDEIRTLEQENIVLKRRLMKTRRALEDTFQHLSVSNKNKKNVEKAIIKQLMITKTILTKTRNYEDMYYEN